MFQHHDDAELQVFTIHLVRSLLYVKAHYAVEYLLYILFAHVLLYTLPSTIRRGLPLLTKYGFLSNASVEDSTARACL